MPVVFDESITHYEIHAHQPYASTSLDNSDEIRITVQNQDLCILPSKSNLHITGKLLKVNNDVATTTKLVNNAICHLFQEIRYEINAIEIDKIKNVGITTLMKNLISFTPNQSIWMENAGWLNVEEKTSLVDANGCFDISIPLNMLLGFAEDYRKILCNVKHELILTRARHDIDALIQTAKEDVKISISKLEWLIPYVTLADKKRIELFNYIQKDPAISMSFRSWELYEYPMLPQTTKHVWTVKTATQLEKPRYVILGFQTARKNRDLKNASNFDHCNITDVKLFLNSQCYPYGHLNINMTQNQYSVLYDMYTDFQLSYYDQQTINPLLNKKQFMTYAPLVVIDCSKQNESLKFGPVDVRLEFETKESIPQETAAYCLILHDRIVEYHPISGGVKKLL